MRAFRLCAIFVAGTSLSLGCQGGMMGSGPKGNDDGGVPWPDGYVAGSDGQPDPVTTPEICNNGLDDDQDGDVDENCACKAGATQACFPGTSAQQGKGICKPGTQTCSGTGEFQLWGECKGAVKPRPEICGDNIDQDCDGKDDPCPGKGTCETFTFGVHSRPVDIIWAIDQSGSMTGEIAMVRQNMNAFASFISKQKVDYHVILVAMRTGSMGVCIPQPLAGAGCANGARFKQLDAYVGSHNALSQTMAQIGGIEAFTRTGSLRHFVVVTDDESSIKWTQFHAFLQARTGYKDYIYHSIVGLVDKGCVADDGQQYIALSNQTKGLKFHICNANWQQLFNQLAQSVITATTMFKLSKTPKQGTIKVTFDGFAMQEGVHYKYDATVNQIVILKQPKDGTKIKVCYEA